MWDGLPSDAREALEWDWERYAPLYADLASSQLSERNVEGWLEKWSKVSELLSEVYTRLYLDRVANTADEAAEKRFFAFLDGISPNSQRAEQQLKELLLASGLTPKGMEVPLRAMRAQAELFREENVALGIEDEKLGAKFEGIIGAQTAEWEGQELPLTQIVPALSNSDRATRERAWNIIHQRKLQDREALNELWTEMFKLRRQMAENAGHADFRSYVWQLTGRFDYTPEDCATFRDAIAEVVVPAATRIYERRRQRLGLDVLRPWDFSNGDWDKPADPPGTEQLRPYTETKELLERGKAIFERVDPQLGAYFQTMLDEQLLDVESRANKGPGAFCTTMPVSKRPFIFMNAVGLHDDVDTLLHEAGHAFHSFEGLKQPFYQQHHAPTEFAEVASMGMELLAAPYLEAEQGGFYSAADAAKARIEHLEGMLLFWPYMAIVDGFQHWAYTNPEDAISPAKRDEEWQRLWARFIPTGDWSGLEDVLVTGWQRKLHIYLYPFYYVEYGLAQLGAVQVWRNALRDQAQAVQSYLAGLRLAGTAPLPELFSTAGARFAFDAATLGEAVALMERTINELDEKTAAAEVA